MSAKNPSDSIPLTAAISSLSELSPDIPTEPIIFFSSSLINTPPGTGTKFPFSRLFTALIKYACSSALLYNALEEEVPNLIKNSVQISFIGDLSQFDQELIEQMKESEKLTYCGTERKKLDLVIAASYGGRWDIVNAINKHLDS